METSKHLFSRHAEKVTKKTPDDEKSEKYFGITRGGERRTREAAKELAEKIRKLPDGAVVILGGVSKNIRTRSTLEAYGDSLREFLADDPEIIFSSKDDLAIVAEQLQNDRDFKKKAVIKFPLWIKQFAAKPEEWAEWNKHFKESGLAADEEIADWIDKKVGPNPDELAGKILTGMKRLENFYQRLFPDRPLVFLNVGHSGELDALFSFLANRGKTSKESFQRLGGKEVEYNEIGEVDFRPDGSVELKYRDQDIIWEK